MISGVFHIDLPRLERVSHTSTAQGGAGQLWQYIGDEQNTLVQAAVNRFLRDAPGCNPLVFFGSPGSGKSLLAHGLAARWKRQHAEARVIVCSGSDFSRQFAAALETDSLEDFHHRHRYRKPIRHR